MIENSKLSFEEALSKLEKCLATLESGEMTLNDSIDAYEEARKLISVCEERLETAKQRVYILNKSESGVNAEEFVKISDEN